MSAALPEGSLTHPSESTAQRNDLSLGSLRGLAQYNCAFARHSRTIVARRRLMTSDPQTGRLDPVRLTLIAGQHWDADRLPYPWRSVGYVAIAHVRRCVRCADGDDQGDRDEGAIPRSLCSQAPTTNAAPSSATAAHVLVKAI